jgi:basic membrane protein A and related proteins
MVQPGESFSFVRFPDDRILILERTSLMITKTIWILFLALLITLLAVSGCGAKSNTLSTKNVGMLFDSPIASDSFSLACLRGAEEAQVQFGIGLDVSESITPAETESLQQRYASGKKYALIFCIGPSHTRPTNRIFTDFPQQKFALIDGSITDKANLTSILSRDNESSFLAGSLAAMLTRTGQIGFVGGMDVPAIHRFLAGYQAGAAYISPSCKVLVGYSGTWINDGKTHSLALQQFGLGADIIFTPAGGGSVGVIEAAREQGLYAIGVDADQSPLAPQNVAASTLKNVDRAVFSSIKQVLDGNFKGGLQTMGLKEGEVALAINETLPLITPQIKSRIAEIEQKIITGEIKVPE